MLVCFAFLLYAWYLLPMFREYFMLRGTFIAYSLSKHSQIYIKYSSNPIRRWLNSSSQASVLHCVVMSRPFAKALRWQIALVAWKDNSFSIWQDETPRRLIMIYTSQLIYIGPTTQSTVVKLAEYDVFCVIVIRGAELWLLLSMLLCAIAIFFNFIYRNPSKHRFIAV